MWAAGLALAGAFLASGNSEHLQKNHDNTSRDPANYPMSNIPPPSRRERPLDRLHVGQAYGIQNAEQRAIDRTGLYEPSSYQGLRPNQARRAGVESSELPLRGYNATDINYHWKWSRGAPFYTEGTQVELAPIRQPVVLHNPDPVLGLQHQPHVMWNPPFNQATGRRRVGTQV